MCIKCDEQKAKAENPNKATMQKSKNDTSYTNLQMKSRDQYTDDTSEHKSCCVVQLRMKQ